MNFPSGEHSGIVTGPLALRWYVVLADISPFTVVEKAPDNDSYNIHVNFGLSRVCLRLLST